MKHQKLVRAVASEVLTAFSAGTLPKALANVFIHRHVEAPSKHWSWSNRTIAILQGHVYAAGFRQWQELGRHVKRGERAFRILGPIVVKREVEADARTSDPEKSERKLIGFVPIPVFGYFQTEGEPLPGVEEDGAFIDGLPLVEVARSWGLSVATYAAVDAPDRRGFFAHGRGIGLGVENLSTWAHELVHAADARLPDQPTKKHAREVIAEFGGAVLLECLGYEVESDRGGAWRYIEHVCEKSGNEPLGVAMALLERTCKAVELLLDEGEKLAARPAPSVASVKRAKLELLAGSYGLTFDQMLGQSVVENLVPSICMNPACDYTTEYEPDQRAGWCEVCGTGSVLSCLVLAGLC